MVLRDIEQEIVNKYSRALKAVGVSFECLAVTETIEDCLLDLETRIQAFLAWCLYLHQKGDRLHDPNNAFIQAFYEEWDSKYWQEEYLFNPLFLHPSQKARQKLSEIEFFRYVAYEIKENSSYVRFFYEGRTVWEVDVEDILSWSPDSLVATFKQKTGYTIAFVETVVTVL